MMFGVLRGLSLAMLLAGCEEENQGRCQPGHSYFEREWTDILDDEDTSRGTVQASMDRFGSPIFVGVVDDDAAAAISVEVKLARLTTPSELQYCVDVEVPGDPGCVKTSVTWVVKETCGEFLHIPVSVSLTIDGEVTEFEGSLKNGHFMARDPSTQYIGLFTDAGLHIKYQTELESWGGSVLVEGVEYRLTRVE